MVVFDRVPDSDVTGPHIVMFTGGFGLVVVSRQGWARYLLKVYNGSDTLVFRGRKYRDTYRGALLRIMRYFLDRNVTVDPILRLISVNAPLLVLKIGHQLQGWEICRHIWYSVNIRRRCNRTT